MLVLCLLIAAGAGRAEEFVVGGEDHPWAASGTTPGGVIAFVDSLTSLVEEGGPLFSTDAMQSDWMLPVRVNPDVNISIGLIDRGGEIDVNLAQNQVDQDELEGILNGDHRVAFDRKPVDGRTIQNNGVIVFIDLGARFGVNRILFYPRMTDQFPFANSFMRGYELYVNNGEPESLFASGQPNFVSPISRNTDNADTMVVIDFDAQFVRYLQLKSVINAGFEIDEIEIYGTGFVPEAVYESFPLDLGEDSVWGTINWLEAIAGDPRDSSIEVRVRSGRDDTPDVFYREIRVGGQLTGLSTSDAQGNPLTQESYEQLLRDGLAVLKQTDIDNWGQWQLVDNGQKLTVPAPRRFIQFRVDFANATLNSARALSELSFEHSPPPVDGLIAEVAPDLARISEPTTFTLAALVQNTSGREGFSRFDVETPARVTAIHSVTIRNAAGTVTAAADFGAIDTETALPQTSGQISLTAVEDDHFSLALPRVAEDGASVTVEFESAVFRYGTRFQGRAFADGADLPILTEPGDATEDLSTDDLLVRVSIDATVAGPLTLTPPTFSPNGDGVNDRTQIEYVVQHLVTPSPVAIDIYDLSGRRVRSLAASSRTSGQFRTAWDGRDDAQNVVPPGLYLVVVEVTSDEGTQRRLRQVAVAY